MIMQIPLSQIGSAEEFAVRVAAFGLAKLDHHATTDVPAPREDEIVERCLRRVSRNRVVVADMRHAGIAG
jgi:hypothetical protein